MASYKAISSWAWFCRKSGLSGCHYWPLLVSRVVDFLVDNVTVLCEGLHYQVSLLYKSIDVIHRHHVSVYRSPEVILPRKRTMAVAGRVPFTLEESPSYYHPCLFLVLLAVAAVNGIVKHDSVSTYYRDGRENCSVVLGETVKDYPLTADDVVRLALAYMAVTYIAGDVKVTHTAMVASIGDIDAATATWAKVL